MSSRNENVLRRNYETTIPVHSSNSVLIPVSTLLSLTCSLGALCSPRGHVVPASKLLPTSVPEEEYGVLWDPSARLVHDANL